MLISARPITDGELQADVETELVERAGVTYANVLLPLDGSEQAATALRTAVASASRFGATLHIVIVDPSESTLDRLGTLSAEMVGLSPADSRIHRVQGTEVALAIDALADELGSCLVCMATHGRGRVAGAMIGSVARTVLRDRRRPVVLVGPLADRSPFVGEMKPPPLTVGRVVACVSVDEPVPDFDTLSTVWAASDWARAFDMPLTVLTVAVPSNEISRSAQTEVIEARLHGIVGHVGSGPMLPDIAVQYDPISVAAGVRTYLSAHPAGLLVVSTHARSGIDRLVHGAAAARIIAESPVATLALPIHPPEASG